MAALRKEVFYTFLVCQVFLSSGSEQNYIYSYRNIDNEYPIKLGNLMYRTFPLGCIISGILMDIFGRKLYFIVTFILKNISWFLIASATNNAMLFGGIIIQGITQGMGIICFTYIAEIMVPSRRGVFLTFLLISHALWEISHIDLLFELNLPWIYAMISLFSTLTILFLPESPLWLLSKGREEAAIRILTALRCSDKDRIQREVEEIKKSTVKKGSTSVFVAWKSLLIVIGFQLLFLMIKYLLELGYLMKYSEQKVYREAKWTGILIAPILMHTINHRIHIIRLVSVMVICAIVAGAFEIILYHYYSAFAKSQSLIPLAFYIFWSAHYAGVVPFAYTIGSELYPCKVRGIMTGIFFMFWRECEISILEILPYLTDWSSFSAIIMWLFSFAALCVLLILFVKYILPETKDKTLNEVQQQYFQKNETVPKNGNTESDEV